MRVMVILNDAPYGQERTYQGLRMADAMLTIEEDLELTLYLSNDAVLCAKAGQQTPDGYYNVERMLKPIVRRGTVIVCRTCAEARGLKQEDLVAGARIVTLGEAAQLALEADKTLVY
ncbi:MAG TPA: DsrE family protein [Thermoanaerobaculales bacterium]|nr:DsrE family protein [Thermoanaerobaculales bacterium]HPA81778.1 DsrE family protein [Thermoanaerobaculales bacterium]HQN96949.1 DsrE family protein [Thermoanaerobaculales bacterium]HQP44484.1 DsrE family protein [Thermoanaerobaculales bacterium]